MKSMKHLLRIVGALALSSAAATSVVACGGQQKTDKEYSAEIVKQLQAGVEGTTLNTLSTQGDALNLFLKAATGIKNGAKVELVTVADKTNKLTEGNNTIKVKVTVGKIVVASTDAVVKGVTSATDAQYVAAIKKMLEAGVDGSSLDISKTQNNALPLLQAKAIEIKVGASVVFATPADGHRRLTEGNNTIRVIVTIGSNAETFNAVLNGVTKTDDEYVEAIKTELVTNVVNGSSLSTLQTRTDALRLFQAVATKIKVGARVALSDPTHGTNQLVQGSNTIQVKVTVGSETSMPFSARLGGVTAPTDKQYVAAIKTALEAGVDGSRLDDSERQDAARDLIQRASNKIVLGATFKFDSGTTPLISGDNIVNIKLTFNTVSETAIAVKLTNVSEQ